MTVGALTVSRGKLYSQTSSTAFFSPVAVKEGWSLLQNDLCYIDCCVNILVFVEKQRRQEVEEEKATMGTHK